MRVTGAAYGSAASTRRPPRTSRGRLARGIRSGQQTASSCLLPRLQAQDGAARRRHAPANRGLREAAHCWNVDTGQHHRLRASVRRSGRSRLRVGDDGVGGTVRARAEGRDSTPGAPARWRTVSVRAARRGARRRRRWRVRRVDAVAGHSTGDQRPIERPGHGSWLAVLHTEWHARVGAIRRRVREAHGRRDADRAQRRGVLSFGGRHACVLRDAPRHQPQPASRLVQPGRHSAPYRPATPGPSWIQESRRTVCSSPSRDATRLVSPTSGPTMSRAVRVRERA